MKHISVDIEASGEAPGEYSMLSIGACFVEDSSIQFYREIQPIHHNYQLGAMKIGCLGLERADEEPFDPRKYSFLPDAVMDRLRQDGIYSTQVMEDFADWATTYSRAPVLITDIQPFDGNFVHTYFANAKVANPFRHKGIALENVYQGIRRSLDAHLSELGVFDDRITPHNALEDAVYQAKIAREVFSMLH